MSVTIRSCEIQLSPQNVDAGAEFFLTARVICDPPQDLTDRTIQFHDQDGKAVAEGKFKEFDGEVNISSRVRAEAPKAPGDYAWQAVFAQTADTSDPLSASFGVPVRVHETRLSVWDVPSAIEAGQRFTVKLGLKCSSGCSMEGRPLTILDPEGHVVCKTEIGAAIWHGSDGLYFAEAELTAPDDDGLKTWQVRAAAHDPGYPHDQATTTFGVRTVAQADCTVRIEAVDHEREQPLANMSIVMHPYRARTDQAGVAEIRVARGTYSVFVSGRGYYPVRRSLEIAGDVTTRAPLQAEPPQSSDW